MTSIAILAAVNAALDLIAKLGPLIASKVAAGEITIEQQQEVDAKVVALRPGGLAFAGPEWQPSALAAAPQPTSNT